jgi:hypothetical protein
MTITMDTLHKEIMELKKYIEFIKDTLKEEHDLSEHAKKELLIARETPESEYSDLE